MSTLDKQDAVIVENHGSNAYDGPFRVFARHQSPSSLEFDRFAVFAVKNGAGHTEAAAVEFVGAAHMPEGEQRDT